jgi:ABC-type amino acid transport substrate-binding protein
MNAFLQGRCDAFTADKSQLVGFRATAPKPEELVILKEDHFQRAPGGLRAGRTIPAGAMP